MFTLLACLFSIFGGLLLVVKGRAIFLKESYEWGNEPTGNMPLVWCAIAIILAASGAAAFMTGLFSLVFIV